MRRYYSILILLFLFLSNLQLKGQATCENPYQLNPLEFFEEIKGLRKAQRFDTIIDIIKLKMTDTRPELWHYYQLACYYALKGDTLKPFQYFYQNISLQKYAKTILAENDFMTLRSTQHWKTLKDSLIILYLSKYPDITDKALSTQLWLISIEDQETRTLNTWYKNQRSPTPEEYNALTQRIQRNEKFVWNLLKKNILPTYRMVGREASDAAILIVSHCDKRKMYRKAIQLSQKVIADKQISPERYASLVDRFRTNYQYKKQMYGTICRQHAGKDSTGQVLPVSEIYFDPIEDEKNVNQRRLELGMAPIEEYAKVMNINYVYDPKNERRSFRKTNKMIYRKQTEQVIEWEKTH